MPTPSPASRGINSRAARWTLRDPEKLRDWDLAALQLCRTMRGAENVEWSRYWLSTATEITILTKYRGNDSSLPQSVEFAKALADFIRLSENASVETWADAQAASDTVTRAGN